MYAAVRTYQIKPDTSAEIARITQEGFVPLVREVPGFVGYYGVVAEGNRIVTISLFEDQAGEEESTRRAREWAAQNIAQFLIGPPEVLSGRIAWQG